MRIRDKIAGTLGLVAALSAMSLAPPAQAQYFNFDSIVRNYVGYGSTEKLAPNQGFIRNNIDTAQARFEAELSAGRSSGQITGYEASELQSRLRHIDSMEHSYMADGGFTYGEVQSLMSELTSLQSRLTTAISSGNQWNNGQFNDQYGDRWYDSRFNGQYGDWRNGGQWNGSRWNPFTGGALSGAEIDQIQAQLATRISAGLNDGRLARREANNLRRHLDNIAGLEADMRSSGGGLTRVEVANLRDRLQNVRSQLTQNLNDRREAGRNDRWY